jgi:hypothetical protein
MDYQYYQQPPQPQISRRSAWMENASLILGILALVTSCLIYPALIGGSLAIVFALLSKGGENTMTAKAIVGLILGSIALFFVALAFVYVFVLLCSMYGGIFGIPVDAYGNLDYNTLMQDMNNYLYSL